MRKQHNIRIRHKARMNLGFALVNIQPTTPHLTRIQCLDQRLFINDCAPRRINDHNAALHLLELARRNGMSGVAVQWQIQRQHIGPSQQFVELHILCPVGNPGLQLVPVVVNNLHAKRLRLLLQIAADTTHAEDAEHLVLWVVTERGSGMSTPVAVAQREHGPVEAAERAEDEEHVCVGGAIVNSGRYVGYADSAACAGGGVDLVVAGALGEMLGWCSVKEKRSSSKLGIEVLVM